MGLRCLVGHDYGEQQTSTDRRQQGSEVVVTVREYRECRRCGHRRVITENKEVTAESTSEPSAEFPLDPSVTASFARPDDDAGSTDAPVDDEPPSPAAFEEPLTAEEDDGIILEDEPPVPVRGYGEWPEADDAGDDADAPSDDEPEPWPHEADVESAEPTAEASASVESTSVESTSVASSPVESSPSASTDAASDPAATGAAVDPADGIIVAEATGAAEPSTPRRPDNRDTELVCPSCAETWPSVNVSLRPGDICPDCHRDYLDERVIQ